MELQDNTNTSASYPDGMSLEILNNFLTYEMDIEEQVNKTSEMMYKYSRNHNRFGEAWALGGTSLRLPTADEESLDITFDQRYTEEWFIGLEKWSQNENHSIIREGFPILIERIKRKSTDVLYCIRPAIEQSGEKQDNKFVLMRNNISYLATPQNKILTVQEAEELLILMKIYLHSHQAHDPEWRDHIYKGFWKYLRKEHRFFILYSSYSYDRPNHIPNWHSPKDIIGFMRITPYASQNDPYAEYLGAANIERPFKGWGLAGHMFREYFENSGTLAQEVYLHAATASPVLNKWKKLWFECIKDEIVPYGKKWRTMNVTLMCLKREKYLDRQKG